MPSHLRFLAFGLPSLLAALFAQGVPKAEICCDIMDGTPDFYGLPMRSETQDLGRITAQVAILDFVVDSTWTRPGSFPGYSALRVLAKNSVDTSVYMDIRNARAPGQEWLDSVSRDAADFPGYIIDSTSRVDFHVGDTLRNVLALRVSTENSADFLAFRGIQCKFLAGVPGPFPVAEALVSLDRYLDSIEAAQGRPARSGKVKIGIVFPIGAGDPGILVTAEADSTAWIVRYQIGSGDCPAGCTDHSETRYRIDRGGSVTVTSHKEHLLLCPPIAIHPRLPGDHPVKPRADLYTPQGRKASREERSRALIPLFESRK